MDFPRYDECPLCQGEMVDRKCQLCDYREPTVEEMVQAHLNVLESALLKRPDPRVRALYLIAKTAVEDPTGANLEELTFALTKFERDAPELIGGETWDEVVRRVEKSE